MPNQSQSVPPSATSSHPQLNSGAGGTNTPQLKQSLMVSLEAVLDPRTETEVSNISPILINHVYILIIMDFYINFN